MSAYRKQAARLTLIALAFVPAAAFAAMSTDEVLAEAAKLPPHVPGQYRTTLELLEIEGPGDAKELATLRQSMSKEELDNSKACDSPEESPASAGVELVQEILEDRCIFDQFNVVGDTVSIIAQCPADNDVSGRVKLNGRIAAESMDLLITVEQQDSDKRPMRMKMRARTERVGACA